MHFSFVVVVVEFSDNFPRGIVEALEDEGFDNLPALVGVGRQDLDGLKLKKGHVATAHDCMRHIYPYLHMQLFIIELLIYNKHHKPSKYLIIMRATSIIYCFTHQNL